MNINSALNFISFKAHSKEVKLADAIMRKSNNTFPMTSPTRIEAFYDSISKPMPSKHKMKAEELQTKIYNQRERAAYKMKLANYVDNPYLAQGEEIKISRLGNCYESAIAAASGLCANGYKANVVNLYCTHSFVNKKTRETEYKKGIYIDHAFVVTDMEKPEKSEGQQIVLDNWVGICGTWNEVKDKFHSVFGHDSDIVQFKENNKANFIEHLKLTSSPNNISDYEERIGFSYYPVSVEITDKNGVSQILGNKFPQLVLNA